MNDAAGDSRHLGLTGSGWGGCRLTRFLSQPKPLIMTPSPSENFLFPPLPTACAPETPTVGNPDLQQYYMPLWAAERIVEQYFSGLGAGEVAYDIGCGPGAFLRAFPAHVRAIGVEIDPALAQLAADETGREVIVGDFRQIPLPARPAAIISNPPYANAISQALLAMAAEQLEPGGRCGLILPATTLSFSSTVERWRAKFNIRQEALPRDLFPRIKYPISFYLFTRSHLRKLHGFFLFDEARALAGAAPRVRLALTQGSRGRSVWQFAVEEAVRALGGEATNAQIYAYLRGRCPRLIPTWKETVRRTLQEGRFIHRSRGAWALAAAYKVL